MSLESIKRLRWLSKQLQAEAGEQGIYQESEGASYCCIAANELAEANARIQELEAKVDALMLEYCPELMTPEQVENWGRNQSICNANADNYGKSRSGK